MQRKDYREEEAETDGKRREGRIDQHRTNMMHKHIGRCKQTSNIHIDMQKKTHTEHADTLNTEQACNLQRLEIDQQSKAQDT